MLCKYFQTNRSRWNQCILAPRLISDRVDMLAILASGFMVNGWMSKDVERERGYGNMKRTGMWNPDVWISRYLCFQPIISHKQALWAG